mgnify:CR=1 FL=1
MIICKTSETNENYDKIIFCRRDIKEITIPSFIKTIGSYSFSGCQQLQQNDISSNSELQTIEKYAFASSSIENIFIPSHATKMCEIIFILPKTPSYWNWRKIRNRIIWNKLNFSKKYNYYDSS